MKTKHKRALSVFNAHALRIAYDTMKMHCVGAMIMGGMNHRQAIEVICELTGAIVILPADCTCEETCMTR